MIEKHYRNWKNHQVVVFGDLHGEFEVLRTKINSSKFDNCFILIAGDCGFGFFTKQKTKGIIKHLEIACKNHHVMIGFLRGNHDDKDFWYNDEYCKNMTGIKNFCSSHIQFIKDFTLTKITNKFNKETTVLNIGGGVSIDRIFRKEGFSYWKGEEIDFYPNLFTQEELDSCEYIVSHAGETPPLIKKDSIDYFLSKDEDLFKDLEKEKLILGLIAKTVKPRVWIYAHFHRYARFFSETHNCTSIVLNCTNCADFYEII